MHRSTTKNGIKLIKKFEGFSKVLYYCSSGYPTIGYGHKLKSTTIKSITESDAEELLKQDLIISETAVIKYINTPLTNYEYDALVSFTFNCGNAALQRSTLRSKINYGDHEAHLEFLKWIYAGAVKMHSLMKRRYVESRIFLGELKY